MTPLYFGNRGRRLFGVYAPACGTSLSGRSALLCGAWGPEYIYSHRSLRHLDRLLVQSGYHVLRFDYFGTGDSDGDMTEATIDAWCDDIETAIDELKDLAGTRRVSLVGLRLGASMAAMVAARRVRDVDLVALWDPVINGQDYLADIRRIAPYVPAPEPFTAPSWTGRIGEWIRGFPVSQDLAAGIAAIDLAATLENVTSRAMCVLCDESPSVNALRSRLASGPVNGRIGVEVVRDHSAWLEQSLRDEGVGAGAVPVQLVKRIADWLA